MPSERENANLVAKILTSKTYSKKLANQQMTYQFIQADQSQSQKNLRQIQVNIPNKDTTSCDSDYFTFSMQMTVDNTSVGSAFVNISNGQVANVVQYKNALYLLTYDSTSALAFNVLKGFKQAIEDCNVLNNSDYGIFSIHNQVSPTNATVIQQVAIGNSSSPAPLDETTPAPALYTDGTDTVLYGNVNKTTAITSLSTMVIDPNNYQPVVAVVQVAYQKICNLPYNSACFVDETALKHANMSKDKELQMQKRQIYRLQYDANTSQEYINQHNYEMYGNDIPTLLYSVVIDNTSTIDFTFTVIIPMNKLFDAFQADFLPLFKLANAINLTIQLNTSLLQNMFKVKTQTSLTAGKVYDVQFIKYNQITYYNIGCYLLNCSDVMMENKLREELNSLQGIILPITQTYVETNDSSIGLTKNYLISNGYNCLSWLELGLVFTNNRAYYSGYTTLKDIMGEYADLSQVGCQQVSPQKDQYDWYTTQYSFYQPQLNINGKQLFIGSQYINSPQLYQIINNRGQTYSDSNPYTYNHYDYFNKLNIRLEQFTDKQVNSVEPNELSFSGYGLSKMQNNFYNVKIANYMISNLQSDLKEASSTDIVLNGQKTFKIEAIYKFKAILKITAEGDLQLMQQMYQL